MASVSGTDQHWRMMEGGGGRRRGSGTKMAAGISKKMEWRAKGFTVGKTARERETDDEEWLVEMAQAWGRRGCEWRAKPRHGQEQGSASRGTKALVGYG